MMKTIIVDYGLGNVQSVRNMLLSIGVENLISSDPQNLKDANFLILPGVGSFTTAALALEQKLSLTNELKKCVIEKKIPILGICLGLQIMCDTSDEGVGKGLGFIEGKVSQLEKLEGNSMHMGWNTVEEVKSDSRIFDRFTETPKFYFVHRYFVETKNEKIISGKTLFANYFCSAIENNNIVGVQFHPEKSHNFGRRLFRNFFNRYA